MPTTIAITLNQKANMKGKFKKMNILGQIGNTPLLKLSHVNETPDIDIYVKCEYLNPGGSIKDNAKGFKNRHRLSRQKGQIFCRVPK